MIQVKKKRSRDTSFFTKVLKMDGKKFTKVLKNGYKNNTKVLKLRIKTLQKCKNELKY